MSTQPNEPLRGQRRRQKDRRRARHQAEAAELLDAACRRARQGLAIIDVEPAAAEDLFAALGDGEVQAPPGDSM